MKAKTTKLELSKQTMKNLKVKTNVKAGASEDGCGLSLALTACCPTSGSHQYGGLTGSETC
jgi:hypothetical protein